MHEHTRFRSRGLSLQYLRGAGRGKSFLGHTGVAHVTCVSQRGRSVNLSNLPILIHGIFCCCFILSGFALPDACRALQPLWPGGSSIIVGTRLVVWPKVRGEERNPIERARAEWGVGLGMSR